MAWYRSWNSQNIVIHLTHFLLIGLSGNDVWSQGLVVGWRLFLATPEVQDETCNWWVFCSLTVILTFTPKCWNCPCHLSAKRYSCNLRSHIVCRNTRLSALLVVRAWKQTIDKVNKNEIIHFCPLCLAWSESPSAENASRRGRNENIY